MALSIFESGMARLDEIVMPGMLCAFDFDGTLAPILREPERVAMPAPIARRMARLQEHAVVAIISGRSVADLRERLDFVPHYLIGNHGLEGVPGANPSPDLYVEQCRRWEQAIAAALAERRQSAAGIRVENKGCSLSLHYRLARDRDGAAQLLAELIMRCAPEAHVIGGKCVLNLLPDGELNKGRAIEQLLAETGAPSALYAGDDLTDEAVFDLRRPGILTVRIGPDSASRAEFFLHHRLDMVRLLDELIDRFELEAGARLSRRGKA